MNLNTTDIPEILPHGLTHLIIRFGLQASPERTRKVRAAHRLLTRADMFGVTEIAASLTTLMIEFEPRKISRSELRAKLLDLLDGAYQDTVPATPGRLWEIPVCFETRYAPQLAEVAGLADVSENAAIRTICECLLEVLTIGFAPGQPYIGNLPNAYDIPRQSELTPMVPAGALILAIRQLIVFAADNATGWRHVGQTGFLPFKMDRATPFALGVGDGIKFVPVASIEMDALLSENSEGLGGARCKVFQ